MPLPRNVHIARDAEIIEYWISTPGVTSNYIADKFKISIMQLSRILDKYFPSIAGFVLTIESGIDTVRAINQETELNEKINNKMFANNETVT